MVENITRKNEIKKELSELFKQCALAELVDDTKLMPKNALSMTYTSLNEEVFVLVCEYAEASELEVMEDTILIYSAHERNCLQLPPDSELSQLYEEAITEVESRFHALLS